MVPSIQTIYAIAFCAAGALTLAAARYQVKHYQIGKVQLISPPSEPHDRIGVSSDRSFDFFGAVFDPSSLGAIEASKAMARTYGSAGLISTIIEVIPVRHKAGRRDRPIGMALSGVPRKTV